jgi:uncharacterized protein YkwD
MVRIAGFLAAICLFLAAVAAAAPSPIPSWYWQWAQWRLGNGAYRCLPFHSASTRPHTPLPVPAWAWDKLRSQIAAGALVRPPCQTTPQPTPPPQPTSGLTADEQAIVDGSNLERQLNDDPLFCGGGPCPPLQVDPHLMAAARDKTQNNASTGQLTHDYYENGAYTPFGSWFQRHCPNTAGGENIAFGYPASTVSNAWVHHPGHRENLLSSAWHYIGASALSSGGTVWAAEDFSAAPCP